MKGWLFRKVQSTVLDEHWVEVLESGHGPTILFVHGATGSPYNFRHQFDALSKQYRCVAISLRGHGRSPWPTCSNIDGSYQDVKDLLGRPAFFPDDDPEQRG